jgi:hypothetical protein
MSVNKLVILCLPLLLAVTAKAQVSAGISISDDGPNSFYLAIGQTYGIPQQEVVVIHERRVPDDEIPVVFFIANRAHVRPEIVVERRLAGDSWMDITLFYHLDPAIFYLEYDGDPGPEYGRVYGYWRHPRNEWGRLRFEDDDIVKMVNLRFVSNHYHMRPEEVMRLRGEHGNFVKVVHVVDSPDYRSHRVTVDKPDDRRGDDRGRGQDNVIVKDDGSGKMKVHDDGNSNGDGKDKGQNKGKGKGGGKEKKHKGK